MPSQFVERKNIVVAYEKYEQAGVEKTAWKTIGEVVVFRNDDKTLSELVKLYNMPGINIRIFPQKTDNVRPATPATPAQPVHPFPAPATSTVTKVTPSQPVIPTTTPEQDEINVNEIPF